MTSDTDPHVREVFVSTTSIRDDIEVSKRSPGDDQVVDDSSTFICEQGQGPVVVLETSNVSNNETFDELHLISTGDLCLDHMRDVEQRHMVSVSGNKTSFDSLC